VKTEKNRQNYHRFDLNFGAFDTVGLTGVMKKVNNMLMGWGRTIGAHAV